MEQVQIIANEKTMIGKNPKEGDLIVDETADFLWRFCVQGKTGKNNTSVIATKWAGSEDYVCPGTGTEKITKRTKSRRRNSDLSKRKSKSETENDDGLILDLSNSAQDNPMMLTTKVISKQYGIINKSKRD